MPGQPGGYPPGFPQIRTCPIKAYGSSSHGLGRQTCYPLSLRGHGSQGSMPPPCFPATAPQLGASFPPPGPPGCVPRVHQYYGALRFPTARPDTLRFLRVTVTTPCACFRLSDQARRRLAARSFRSGNSVKPDSIDVETAGRPKFLGNPDVPAPCSQTPARPTLPGHTVGRHGPTHSVPRGLSTRGNFGAQSHGMGTRCLRFAVRITPPHARLASGCGPRSTRRD